MTSATRDAGASTSAVTRRPRLAGARSLVRMARYGRPLAGRLFLAVVIGAATATAAIGLMATSAWLIARAAERPPVLYLMVAVTAVRTFGIGRGVLRYAERLTAHDAAFRVLAELRASAYEHLERLAPAGLQAFHSGDLLARIVSDVDALADVWLRVLIPYGSAVLAVGGAIVVVGYLAPAAGLVVAVAALVGAVGAPLVGSIASRSGERRIGPLHGELATATLNLLGGAPELVAAGSASAVLRRTLAVGERLASAEARAAQGVGATSFVAGLAGGAAVWLALGAGIGAVRDGALGSVGLAVVALTPLAVNEVVAALSPAAVRVPGLAASARRVEAILRHPIPVREPTVALALPHGPFGLRVRGLRLTYTEAGADGASRRHDVLDGLDLDVRPGTRALVTGPSGSGKSSLAAALLRFLEPSAGSIELIGSNGAVDISRIAGSDVRRIVGLCEQDPHVFDSTIAENVRLARPDATEPELRAALEAAQLRDWTESLPEGLDTPVGEHGARLSGGQRQRLAVARALLVDVPVIVFDEPTEHVNEAMAAALVEDLLRATAGRTVAVMTHRPELMATVEWDVRVDLATPTIPRAPGDTLAERPAGSA